MEEIRKQIEAAYEQLAALLFEQLEVFEALFEMAADLLEKKGCGFGAEKAQGYKQTHEKSPRQRAG